MNINSKNTDPGNHDDESKQTETTGMEPALESAIWAVVTESVPPDALERIKSRAKALADETLEHETQAPQLAAAPPASRDTVLPASRSQQNTSGTPLTPAAAKSPAILKSPTVLKYSLAASILAVVVGGLAWVGLPLGNANLYAQAAERFETLRSMVCRVQFSTTGTPETSNQQNVQLVTYLAPALHRIEDEQLGTVQIIDSERNRSLFLNAAAKQAIVVDGPAAMAMDAASPVRLTEVLRRHIRVDRANDPSVKELGTRRFGGLKAQGYQSTIGGEIVNAWFDLETHRPVFIAIRFEIPTHLADGNAQPMWRIMSDFEFDVDVSRSLFATEVPDDYQALTIDGVQPNPTPASLRDVIAMLRQCADANDSKFPLRLSMNDDEGTPMAIQHRFAETLSQRLVEGSEVEKAAAMKLLQEFGTVMGRATAFLYSVEASQNLKYFGGATLDQPDRPLLWYSPDADDNYQVVYADLTTQSVKRDELPAEPEPVVQSTPDKMIRVSTPRFELPRTAIRDYTVLQQLRRDGEQASVEYLELIWMPEFKESQVQRKPGDEIVMQVVDPEWKPNRSAASSRLTFLREFPNLKGLDLGHLYLTKNDLDIIGECSQLLQLSLSGVRVFESKSRRLTGSDLASLSNLTRLQVLDLSQSDFAGGLEHLAGLPRLHTLHLSSFEHLNDASVAELKVLPQLESLVLAPIYSTNSKTRVTDAGLRSLQQLPKLKTLYVGYHGKWTLPIDRLRELLPDVDVRPPTDE